VFLQSVRAKSSADDGRCAIDAADSPENHYDRVMMLKTGKREEEECKLRIVRQLWSSMPNIMPSHSYGEVNTPPQR
jgi:hypothetical protein